MGWGEHLNNVEDFSQQCATVRPQINVRQPYERRRRWWSAGARASTDGRRTRRSRNDGSSPSANEAAVETIRVNSPISNRRPLDHLEVPPADLSRVDVRGPVASNRRPIPVAHYRGNTHTHRRPKCQEGRHQYETSEGHGRRENIPPRGQKKKASHPLLAQ